MSLPALVHLLLHALAPLALALMLFRPRWRTAYGLMLCGWLIDLDHLLATPVYAPDRCSLGFHPLHSAPAVAAYGAMLLLPQTRLLGLGLSLHIVLDASDCLRMGWRPERLAADGRSQGGSACT